MSTLRRHKFAAITQSSENRYSGYTITALRLCSRVVQALFQLRHRGTGLCTLLEHHLVWNHLE